MKTGCARDLERVRLHTGIKVILNKYLHLLKVIYYIQSNTTTIKLGLNGDEQLRTEGKEQQS